MGFPFRITGRRFFKFFLPGFLGICNHAGGEKQGGVSAWKTKVGYIFREIKAGFFKADYRQDFRGLYIGAVQGAYIRGYDSPVYRGAYMGGCIAGHIQGCEPRIDAHDTHTRTATHHTLTQGGAPYTAHRGTDTA